MPRSSPQLHRDILRLIAEHADRKTACVMMRCCRALYQDAVATVLAEPVFLDYYWIDRIRSDNRLVSFIRFMRAEDGRRWRFLRGLMFGDREFNPRMAQALAEGISQATNITYLEFEQLESLLTNHGDIRDALTTLKNVKHLKLSNAAKHACTFLESVQWPLVTVGLMISDESGGEWDLPDIYKRLHPASLLQSARETLVQVSCNSWDITQYGKDSPDYPNVKRFEIEGVWFPTMPQWVKTYPNLTTLLVFPLGTDIADMDEDDRAEFDSIRQANLEALEKRCWPKLDGVIAGSVADFYVLGLPCHVHTLDLGVATWCLPLLPDALDRVRPVVIRVSTDGEFFASKFKTYFEQASNALQDLEELKVTIRFYSDVQDIPRVLVSPVVELVLREFL